jgi:hypothetical protein
LISGSCLCLATIVFGGLRYSSKQLWIYSNSWKLNPITALPMPLLSLCRAIPIDLPPSAVREIVSIVAREKRSKRRRTRAYNSIHSALTSRTLLPGTTASQKKSSCETKTTKSVWSNMAPKHRKATSSPSEAAGPTKRPSSSTTRQGCFLSRVWTGRRLFTGNLSHYRH